MWKAARRSGIRGGSGIAWLALAAAIAAPAQGVAQQSRLDLPFAPGERLTYSVRSVRFGGLGKATMSVHGPELVRGQPTYLLDFEMRGRVAIAAISDRTRSWIDPETMATYRYEKRERSPLSGHSEEVELFPAERRFATVGAEDGVMPTEVPLDELSFLYFIRTLPLRDDDQAEFNRHFDPARNPVRIRVVARETIAVPAGTFHSIVVEMRVNDRKRFGGSGVLRMHLSDDERRIPLRIESSVPVAGRIVMDLQQTSGTLVLR